MKQLIEGQYSTVCLRAFSFRLFYSRYQSKWHFFPFCHQKKWHSQKAPLALWPLFFDSKCLHGIQWTKPMTFKKCNTSLIIGKTVCNGNKWPQNSIRRHVYDWRKLPWPLFVDRNVLTLLPPGFVSSDILSGLWISLPERSRVKTSLKRISYLPNDIVRFYSLRCCRLAGQKGHNSIIKIVNGEKFRNDFIFYLHFTSLYGWS